MKKYNILFTAALSQELKIIKEEIKNINSKDINFNFFQTWVWNYNTIYNLSNYLFWKKIDFLVSIWVCWKINNSKNDIFQIARIKIKSNKKEAICPIYINFLKLESILSSEIVITNEEEMLDEKYVDMESFATDFVSSKEKIPYILLKIPFDTIWENSKNVSLEELKEKIRNIDYKKLINEIEKYLENNKKEIIDLSIYKKHFSLSFAEEEILKKLIYKYEALSKNKFINFFEKNKNLSKKEFFNLIDKL